VTGLSARTGRAGGTSGCLDLVKLSPLMARSSGRPEIAIGLIDGPVALDHPDLTADNIREVPGKLPAACADAEDSACAHGTFIAGILLARRASVAPAIAPGCSLLVRPIFAESPANGEEMLSASAGELADAIIDVIGAGARVINLSVALQGPSPSGGRSLQDALDFALRADNRLATNNEALTYFSGAFCIGTIERDFRLWLGLTLVNGARRLWVENRACFALGHVLRSLIEVLDWVASGRSSAGSRMLTVWLRAI
jgi:subtilisin family serine protease